MESSLADRMDALACAEARQIGWSLRITELEDEMDALKARWSHACEQHRQAQADVATLNAELSAMLGGPLS
jgi:hypothetical protein